MITLSPLNLSMKKLKLPKNSPLILLMFLKAMKTNLIITENMERKTREMKRVKEDTMKVDPATKVDPIMKADLIIMKVDPTTMKRDLNLNLKKVDLNNLKKEDLKVKENTTERSLVKVRESTKVSPKITRLTNNKLNT